MSGRLFHMHGLMKMENKVLGAEMVLSGIWIPEIFMEQGKVIYSQTIKQEINLRHL